MSIAQSVAVAQDELPWLGSCAKKTLMTDSTAVIDIHDHFLLVATVGDIGCYFLISCSEYWIPSVIILQEDYIAPLWSVEILT